VFSGNGGFRFEHSAYQRHEMSEKLARSRGGRDTLRQLLQGAPLLGGDASVARRSVG
jgi:hypothetical protein